MEPRPADPPQWLPVARAPVPDPVPPPRKPRFSWRKLTRTPRGAVGLGVLAAALLLWPFSGLSWIPWLVGLGALVILRLLRLEGLLRGWDIPLAGVVVVAGLMMSTSPWAWALAASIGVLLAGLAQLPGWKLAAVGAALCLVTGVGFGFANYRTIEAQRQVQAHAGDLLRVQLGETRPARVLPAMVTAIVADDPDPICRLLTPAAEAAVLSATRTADCAAAVSELHRRVAGSTSVGIALPLPVATTEGWQVDACATPWGTAAGKELGRVLISQTGPGVQRFATAGFASC